MQLAERIVAGGTNENLTLTVLYDERCPLCRRLRAWLGSQPTINALRFVAADAPEAHTRVPALDHERTTRVLTVIMSDGAVYEGERAWLARPWGLPPRRPASRPFGSGAR